MSVGDDDTQKDSLVEEDSVHGHVGENASIADTRVEVPFEDDNDSSDSYEGRLRECGNFYNVCSPLSDASLSVHFSHHYFMLNRQVYWSRSAPFAWVDISHRASVNVKVEKLLQCAQDNIQDSPLALPDSIDDNPSINMAEGTLATSTRSAQESQICAEKRNEVVHSGTLATFCCQNSTTSEFVLSQSIALCLYHGR
jgi:hypothetical protein